MGNDQNKWDINANTITTTTINGNNVANGVKATQSAVADPTAEGTSIEFIDSISQNTQGVITPTKKTVASATTSTAGLMSAADKSKLDGIEAGAEVNPDIANNLTETTTGKVLDATQGKVLKDTIDNLDAEDVGAIKDDYSYDAASYPYTGQELILLHNNTTGENTVTDVASFLSSAGGGSGTNQGALVHYTKTISVSAGSAAQTFPNSGTDDNITENMVVLQAVISNPAAQGSDWTFTTANGTVTLNGTVNAATNVTLYFGVSLSAAPSIQVNLGSTSADNILKTNPTPGVMGTLGRGNGGTGVSATDAADLRSKLGITPANIGAVAKTGDTMTGPLTVPSISVKADLPIYYLRDVNGLDYAHMRGDNTDHHIIFRATTPGGIPQLYEDYNLPNPTFQSGGIGYDILTTKSPVTIPQGGTGATDAAFHIENEYTSILDAINAVKNTRIFPISVQKSGTALYNDMPTTDQAYEWNLLLIGNSTRITATLYLFALGSKKHIYVRDFYNGRWLDSQWTQIH